MHRGNSYPVHELRLLILALYYQQCNSMARIKFSLTPRQREAKLMDDTIERKHTLRAGVACSAVQTGAYSTSTMNPLNSSRGRKVTLPHPHIEIAQVVSPPIKMQRCPCLLHHAAPITCADSASLIPALCCCMYVHLPRSRTCHDD